MRSYYPYDPTKFQKRTKKGELTVITANSPSALMSNGSKKTPKLTTNSLIALVILLAPGAGLGHYGPDSRFFLRNLPFGFLTPLPIYFDLANLRNVAKSPTTRASFLARDHRLI